MTEIDTGYRPSPVDHRDFVYGIAAPVPTVAVPDTFDYEVEHPIPVLDQGRVPACVGFSLAALKIGEEALETGKDLNFHGLDIYKHISKPGQEGAVIRDGLDYLRSPGAVASRKHYPISVYAGVQVKNHVAVKTAIFNQGPLVCGFEVPRFFMNGGGHEFHVGDGQPHDIVGGHAILVVGYDSTGVILHNSWGEGWGDKGRTTVDWEFWDTYFMEAWAVSDAKNVVKRHSSST